MGADFKFLPEGCVTMKAYQTNPQCHWAALQLVVIFSLIAIPGFGQAGGIRGINFREFTYPVGPPYCEDMGTKVTVHRGKFANKTAYFEVAQALYGNLTGTGEQAVVVATCAPKQQAHPGFENDMVYVFGESAGKPVLLAVFAFGQPWNFRGWAPEPKRADNLMLFDVTGVAVDAGTIKFERMAGEARCCPTAKIAQTFRWQNGRFVLAGEQRRRWE
jgi:hypothetical protein